MKKTINIKVVDKRSYPFFVKMLIRMGYKQIGTTLFENNDFI